MTKKVWVVVCYDRHCDDDIQVFGSLASAEKFADEFMDRYEEGRYQWTQSPDAADGSWIYWWNSNADDGPNVHIEPKELLL